MLIEAREKLDYQPKDFLRCHSKNHDKADIRTQVWQAVFEPTDDPKWVATCGGNKVCIIDYKRSHVDHRYTTKKQTEILQALSWGRICNDDSEMSIIAIGGKRTIFFVQPKSSFEAERLGYYSFEKRNSEIFSLLFHPDPAQSNLLFCALKEGGIYLLAIDLLHEKFDARKVITYDYEITRIVISEKTLLAASEEGLCSWECDSETITNELEPKFCKYLISEDSDQQNVNTCVDSVEVLKGDLIASKCIDSGSIYIFKLNHPKNIVHENSINVFIMYKLKWCETDEFIEIGVNFDFGLLTCGDVDGSIFLYDVGFLKEEYDYDGETKTITEFKKLEWPTVNDEYLIKSKKLDHKNFEIIVIRTAIHPRGDHIIAVTNNNTVCIWEKKSIQN